MSDMPSLNIGAGVEPAALEVAPAAPVTPKRPPKPLLKGGYHFGTGRRKTAIARVRIKLGTGKFLVNERPREQFFHIQRDQDDVIAPLRVAEMIGKVDVHCSVLGGGPTGQAGAILLGVSRALVHFDVQHEAKLRDAGFLTRDSRKVERKKYGRSGARKRFQFSKR